MKLKEAYLLFEENRKTYCGEKTLRNYGFTLSYFFNFAESDFGVPAEEIDVRSIDIHLLNRYSIYLSTKKKNDTGEQCISARTRKDYLKDVSTFFNFLFDNEHIEQNPALKLRYPRVDNKIIIPLTQSEVMTMLSCYCSDSFLGSRNIAILRCLLDEGMRSGEVLRLKVKDVLFDKKMVQIYRSKHNKSRVLPLAPVTMDSITEYLKYRKNDSEYLFTSFQGEQMTPDSLKCMFYRLKKSSGITRIYPHLLRHTFATSFIMGGGSVEILRVYMGHSDITTTQEYLHIANNLVFMEDIYRIDKCFRKRFY